MNGSSGFRGVPRTGNTGGVGGTSSGGGHNLGAEMNPALRSYQPPYFPRLESLASPLYNPADVTAGRLFPTAHLSALHAAAIAAASNIPQTTVHHGIPQASALSHFQQAAAAAVAAAAVNQQIGTSHHPLLSPFMYPHLPTSPYSGQPLSAATSHQPPPFGTAHPRSLSYGTRPDLALLSTGNIVPQYSSQSSTSSAVPSSPFILNRATILPAIPSNSTIDRSLSDSDFKPTTVITRPRQTVSPNSTAISSSTHVAGVAGPRLSHDNPPSSRLDQRRINTSTKAMTGSTQGVSTDSKNLAATNSKKQQKGDSCGGLPTQPYYPSHFMKGTVIQLANGDLKRVEDLNTEDFVKSAHLTNELKIDTSQVARIEEKSGDIVLLTFSVGGNKVQVSVEATVEHPFFVLGQGWSSINPERTQNLYGLHCHKLKIGDVCISLTHRDVSIRTSTEIKSSTSSSSTPNVGSASAVPQHSSSGIQHSQSVSSSLAFSETSSNECLTGFSGDKQQVLSKRTQLDTHYSSGEGELKTRKKRKTSSPVRSDLAISSYLFSPWNRYLGKRLAITPPAISTQSRPPLKRRRWSM